jgi:hypothetical protein
MMALAHMQQANVSHQDFRHFTEVSCCISQSILKATQPWVVRATPELPQTVNHLDVKKIIRQQRYEEQPYDSSLKPNYSTFEYMMSNVAK